jgi:hypothetical protein
MEDTTAMPNGPDAPADAAAARGAVPTQARVVVIGGGVVGTSVA